jgi:hypothetical protein
MRCIILLTLCFLVANIDAWGGPKGKVKPGGFGKAKPGGFGKPNPGGFGKPKPGGFGKPNPGGFGKPKPGWGKPGPKGDKSNVVNLTAELFDQLVVSSPSMWMVKFYAPCKCTVLLYCKHSTRS